MFTVIWEYEVCAGAEDAFEALYGAHGEWVRLFRGYEGYIDTELLRGGERRYLTLDRWTSAAAYDAFQRAARSRYAQIDAKGDALTSAERCVGRYESC